MSRRSDKFDRYFVAHGAARHVKFRRLNTMERHAFFLGVLSIAGQAPLRGCLLVGSLKAEPEDIAQEADVHVKFAASALEKLREVGVIYSDEELGCERVHDFEDWNPAPRVDTTSAERQKRYRDRLRAHQPDVSHAVTSRVTHATEVEEKKEVTPLPLLHVDFEEWAQQYEQTTGHALPARTTKAFKSVAESYAARRSEGYSVDDLKLATVGAHADDYRRENGYDVAESILRPTKIAALIAKGKLRSGGRNAAKSSLDIARELRGGAA